jgi:hypothetical protein
LKCQIIIFILARYDGTLALTSGWNHAPEYRPLPKASAAHPTQPGMVWCIADLDLRIQILYGPMDEGTIDTPRRGE